MHKYDAVAHIGALPSDSHSMYRSFHNVVWSDVVVPGERKASGLHGDSGIAQKHIIAPEKLNVLEMIRQIDFELRFK